MQERREAIARYRPLLSSEQADEMAADLMRTALKQATRIAYIGVGVRHL